MGLFSKDVTYAGIEIGGSGIKAVIVEPRSGKAVLKNYALVELSVDWPRDPSDEHTNEVVAYLNEVRKRLNLKDAKVFSALPTFSVFTALLRLPRQEEKALESAVQMEARKYVTLPPEDLTIDYKLLDPLHPPKGVQVGDTVRVLVTATSRSMVARYMNLFKKAEISVSALETEGFALSRAFLGQDPGTVMVVDIGMSTTDILVFEQGAPSFSRTLDLGGSVLTAQLAKQLSVPADAAEQLKRDVGMLPEPPQGTTLQVMHASPLEAVMAPILNEIRYAFTVFQQERGHAIEKIVLTGGSSYIPNLPARIERLLQTRVLLGNPWARISTPPVLSSALEEIAPRMSVAAGLALRGLDHTV